jgi:hypothetical protein
MKLNILGDWVDSLQAATTKRCQIVVPTNSWVSRNTFRGDLLVNILHRVRHRSLLRKFHERESEEGRDRARRHHWASAPLMGGLLMGCGFAHTGAYEYSGKCSRA